MTATFPLASDLAALRRTCTGPVLAPGEPGFDDARRAWNLAVDQHPALVAVPADAHDVAAVVRHARAAGLRVNVQGTGHGAGALGDLQETALVRTTALTEVRVDADARRARVGAGVVWRDVAVPASAHGLAPLAGSSPDVGVVGYSLGGGLGWLARRHGLACNSVTAVELVTADGELVRVDADAEPDLFWALRGGGGSFGAVTAMEFALHPAPAVVAGALLWPAEEAERVLGRWAQWVEEVPEELTSTAGVTTFPPLPAVPEPLRGRSFATVTAALLGDLEAAGRLLAPLRELGPQLDTFAPVAPAALVDLAGDPPQPVPVVSDHTLLAEVTPQTVEAFAAMTGPGSGSPLLMAQLRHLGGALGRAPEGAGALATLDAGFAAFAVGMPMDAEHGRQVARHARDLVDELAPWSAGRAYLNFAERPTDTATGFPAAVHRRLAEVKAAVDPEDVFRANHPIAPAA
jgi:hypothetical protein